jgi:hypothetical protein
METLLLDDWYSETHELHGRATITYPGVVRLSAPSHMLRYNNG